MIILMSRYGSNMYRDHCPCNHRNRREGLLGDRYDRNDRYDKDDRYKMRGRHGLQGGRYDKMHGRHGMEYRRERDKKDCCW